MDAGTLYDNFLIKEADAYAQKIYADTEEVLDDEDFFDIEEEKDGDSDEY